MCCFAGSRRAGKRCPIRVIDGGIGPKLCLGQIVFGHVFALILCNTLFIGMRLLSPKKSCNVTILPLRR